MSKAKVLKATRQMEMKRLIEKLNHLKEEYPDVNLNQYRLVRMTHENTATVCVVAAVISLILLQIFDIENGYVQTIISDQLAEIIRVVCGIILFASLVAAACYALEIPNSAVQLRNTEKDYAKLKQEWSEAQEKVNAYSRRKAKLQPLVDKFRCLEPIIAGELNGEFELDEKQETVSTNILSKKRDLGITEDNYILLVEAIVEAREKRRLIQEFEASL